MAALSPTATTRPIEPTIPLRANARMNFLKRNWASSTGRCNTGSLNRPGELAQFLAAGSLCTPWLVTGSSPRFRTAIEHVHRRRRQAQPDRLAPSDSTPSQPHRPIRAHDHTHPHPHRESRLTDRAGPIRRVSRSFVDHVLSRLPRLSRSAHQLDM